MNDDDFAAALRDRVRSAPLDPASDPAAVLGRARRARARRRLGAAAGSAAALVAVAALVVPAALDASGTSPDDGPVGVVPGSPTQPATERATPTAPARETNGVRVCSGDVAGSGGGSAILHEPDGTTWEVGGLEGWWNATPANADGTVMAVEEWPQQILDHPATVQVETVSGAVLESFDRRVCGPVEPYVPPPLDTLPADAIVVLDALTGEILAQQPLGAPPQP